MSGLLIRILIGVVVLAFICVSLVVTRPVSGGGRLARKLCIVNAVGWICILPLSTTGHPPAFLFPMILFWLVNLVLLPAAATALWTSHKKREESVPYLAVASSYIILNLVVLFVIPALWLLREAS
jgi:hypothetical protein